MPSDRSLYRKIQEVLEIAKAVDVSTLEDLRQAIKAKRSHIFNTQQYDAERDSMTSRVSTRVIQQTVRLCGALELIGADGGVTEAGREALKKGRFESTVAHKTSDFLRKNGVRLSALNQSIAKSLESRPPVLPTASHLWQSANGGSLRYGTFARLLTLLGHCGGAEVSQKKIYLRISIG